MKKILIISILLIFPFALVPYADALIIGDNSTGGECNTVGMWNSTSRTCILLGNVTDSIVLDANLITLDGNNFKLIGPGGDFENYGILSEVMFGITIQNIIVDDFYVGIQLRDSFNNTITNNTIQNIRFEGIDLESFSENNLISENTVINNGGHGITVADSDNIIQDNFVHGNIVGISDFGSTGNIIINNDVQFNTQDGFEITGSDLIIQNNEISNNSVYGIRNTIGENVTISDNIISDNLRGIFLGARDSFVYQNNITGNTERGFDTGEVTNKIYNNNFLNNAVNARDSSANASFNLAEPVGGNYWDDFSQICTNANNDNFCDNPYPFSGGSINVHDNFVWVLPDGWLTKFTGDEDIIANATGTSGAIVNYAVSASHDGDSIPVTCDPVSGSLFPEGNSTVTCTASNGIVTSFTVTVNPLFITECLPPVNGNWLISEDCMLGNNSLILGNVTVQANYLLVITADTTLFLPIGNKITIEQDAGVLIKSGGAFRIVSGVNSASISMPQGTSVPGCEIFNECYIPHEVTIDVGGEVTWSNDDSVAHTVTSGNSDDGPTGDFDSSLFGSGTTFSHTFLEAGMFEYFCQVHPWMEGIVNVIE